MRAVFLPGVLISLLAATPPAAQAITFFLDIGDHQSGVAGGPMTGTNPSVLVSPGDAVELHLWALPDTDDNKFIAAVGLDIVATGPGANFLSAVQFDFDNPALAGGTRWSGTALVGGLNTDGKLVSDQRAVFVPLSLPIADGGLSSFSAASDPGYDSASGAVHLGRLVLAAAPGGAVGLCELRLVVSSLLVTHVSTTSPSTPEPVFFGYASGAAEAALGDGSTKGATSATDDATVVIRRFGDADLDGDVDLSDYAVLAGCMNGPDTPPLQPSGCLEPFDADQDSDVDLRDVKAFLLTFP